MPGGIMSLAAYGAQDWYISHAHYCHQCSGKYCCDESKNNIFRCIDCHSQSIMEVELCCRNEIPTELIDILKDNMRSQITICGKRKNKYGEIL